MERAKLSFQFSIHSSLKLFKINQILKLTENIIRKKSTVKELKELIICRMSPTLIIRYKYRNWPNVKRHKQAVLA